MKINPSQRLTTPRPGGYITASMLALVAEKIKSSIKGGKGILVHRVADQVIVEARATGGRTAQSTADTIWYTATTKAGLPSASTVEQTAMARITSDSSGELGMVCVVNPDRDGWDALNFFE